MFVHAGRSHFDVELWPMTKREEPAPARFARRALFYGASRSQSACVSVIRRCVPPEQSIKPAERSQRWSRHSSGS
jgi:hypothetical protein